MLTLMLIIDAGEQQISKQETVKFWFGHVKINTDYSHLRELRT